MHPRDFDVGLDEPSIGRLVDRADAGETLTFETQHRRKDGSMFPVEIRTHRFAQAGEPVYLCLVRDISERRRAEESVRTTEERFRTLVDAAADAFMLHAPDGTVIDVNLQACESLGYTRDELIGMKPGQFDADLDPEVLKQVAARVGTGEPFTFETRHRRKDGTMFPVEVRARQVWQGDSWCGISMSRNITDRKRGEEERERLRRLEGELARVNRVTAMGELAASIAHEVNQALGAMVANAAAAERWLAAKRPETQKARRTLQAISADGRRAGEVIGRIRALMKRQQPRKTALDVNEAIRDVVALAQQEMSRHAIVLAMHAAEGLPSVQADKVQLQQVLLNLVINAIEAMSEIEDRARELTIASSVDDARVVVEVRDSGAGLQAQRAEQLFEAFYTTKPQGLGIGLSISRSIIEAHGGRLWAESNTPHGAVFRFSLPVGA
jgi:PAS domain S-box-containing protein